MNRWTVRMVGILMILGFLLIFAYLQKRLIELQQRQGAVPARSR